MSGHDEQSIPLGDAQASHEESGERMETAESQQSTGETADSIHAEAQPPSAESDELTALVEHTLLRIRTALEQKDWQAVADAIGLESLFLDGHPEPTAKVVEDLIASTTNLCDFEGVLLRVNKNEITADRGRFSLRFRIMWNSCDDWEDHDLYVDAHSGYVRNEGGWKISYLSMSNVPAPAEPQAPKVSPPSEAADSAKDSTPVAKPAAPVVPQGPAAHPAPARAIPRVKRAAASGRPLRLPPRPASAPHPAATPKPAEQPLSDDYFTMAAAQYFSQVATPEKGAGEPKSVIPGSSVGGKHHLLYVPVVMHEDLVRKILGGD
jgi:hypothetical protein